MCKQEKGFAWNNRECGHFHTDFFPPIDFPIIPHTPWIQKNIPIPPGIYNEVCHIICKKTDAEVYECSNSSYHCCWFCVLKKDGKSLWPIQRPPLLFLSWHISGLPVCTYPPPHYFLNILLQTSVFHQQYILYIWTCVVCVLYMCSAYYTNCFQSISWLADTSKLIRGIPMPRCEIIIKIKSWVSSTGNSWQAA